MRAFFVRCRILLQRHRWLQVVWLVTLWWGCDVVARTLDLPVPGSVIGIAALFVLLAVGLLPSAWVQRGANGLLDHLLLFFVPATMALINHRELFGMLGLKLLFAVLTGTIVVMAGTALVVDFCLRWTSHHAE